MSLEPSEWITIAEAAKRLGLVERQARRWADKLPADGRRQEETTPGRSRALIRLDLLTNLMTGHMTGQVSGHVSGQEETPEMEASQEPESQTFQVPLQLAMTAQRDALERVISEQAARICDLQAALEHERGQSQELNAQSQRLTEALAREQTLRLLDTQASNASEPDAKHSDTSASAKPAQTDAQNPHPATDTQNAPDPPQMSTWNQIRAFWSRYWY